MDAAADRADNRSVKRNAIRVCCLGAFLALRLGVGAIPAFAQVPPIPPLPQPSLPPQAQPVFELLGPTLYPPCGTAALVLFEAASTAQGLPKSLNDSLVGEGLPPAVPDPGLGGYVYNVTGPVFAICGQVPRPREQLTCLFDQQAQDAVNAVTAQVGVPLPLGLHPEGDIVEQSIYVEDRLPMPQNLVDIAATTKIVLGCAEAEAPPPAEGDYSVPPSYTAPPPLGSYAPPPTTPLPGVYAPPPATQQPPPILAQQPPSTSPAGDAVRYAAVWLLPLGLMLFGGYFGGALTRELEPGAFSS